MSEPTSQYETSPYFSPGVTVAQLGRITPEVLSSLNTGSAINVQWHGAVGDGTTDDTAAVARAVRVAKLQRRPLYFPYTEGGYAVDADTVKLNWQGATLVGDPGALLVITGTGTAGIYIDAGLAATTVTPNPDADTFTAVAHGFVDGDGPMQVTASTTIPAGLSGDEHYFIKLVDDDTFQLTAGLGGAVATFTDDGTGTVKVALLLSEVHVSNISVSGSATVDNGVYLRHAHRSYFGGIDVRNVPVGFLHLSGVENTIDRFTCSVNSHSNDWTVVPTTGIKVGNRTDDSAAPDHSVGVLILRPLVEGVSGVGISLDACDQVSCVGGTSEGNGTGIATTINGGSHKFDSMFMEANTTDISCGSFFNTFVNCFCDGQVTFPASSYGNTLVGGQFVDVTNASIYAQGYEGCAISGTLTDTVTREDRRRTWNVGGAGWATTPGVARVFSIVNAAAKGTNNVHALIDSTSTAAVTSGITNPDVPRNLRVVKSASWDGGTVTVAGTDTRDQVISEVFPALVAGTEVGTKVFKTVTSVLHSIALDGGAGYSVGTGDLLGISGVPADATNYILWADGVAEAATLSTTYPGFTPTTVPDGAVDYVLVCNVL